MRKEFPRKETPSFRRGQGIRHGHHPWSTVTRLTGKVCEDRHESRDAAGGQWEKEVKEMEPIVMGKVTLPQQTDNDKRQSCRSTLTYKDSDKENYWGVGERR